MGWLWNLLGLVSKTPDLPKVVQKFREIVDDIKNRDVAETAGDIVDLLDALGVSIPVLDALVDRLKQRVRAAEALVAAEAKLK